MVQPIHRDDIVLVVAPTHPLAMREVIKLDEMMQFPLLLLKHGRQRTQLNNFFHHHEVQPRIAMELDSSELLKRLICAELGMGFLPRANVLDDEHSGLLKIVKVEGMKLHRELALIFSQGQDAYPRRAGFSRDCCREKRAGGLPADAHSERDKSGE